MFRRFFPRRPAAEELDEELQSHFDMEVRLLQDRGFSREEAEARARQSFGNRTLTAEQTRAAWRWQWFDRLSQDLHFAARTLLRSPAYSIAAILSLALGIGAGTAVFSIADTVFLRPLPYVHPEELLWVATRFPGMNVEFLASPDYVTWRRDNHVFRQLSAIQAQGGQTMLLNGSQSMQVHGVRVSANFLSTFGAHPILGRDFTQSEELPNSPKAVLISYRLWHDRFRGATNISGQTIRLDGEPYTVAGVLPDSFAFPMDVKVDVITTLPVSPTASHHDRMMATWAVYGRLKPGITIAQARADLEKLFAASKADIPLMFRSDTRLVVEPLQQHRVGSARLLLWILVGAVGCLLLIACANVSNLLLGRWSSRAGEFAIRAAIGAGRSRLTRQLFTEAAFLTVIGCTLGAFLVVALLRGFVHYAAGELPRLSEVSLDARVFIIGLLLATFTTLLFGTLPALRSGRLDIQSVLQESGRLGLAAGYRFAKRALVIAEVALSLILLSGAALLLQTLWHLQKDRLGFQPEHAFTMSIPLKSTKLEAVSRDTLAEDLVEFARHLPGTVDAAQAECTPLDGGVQYWTFSRSDRPLPEAFHRGDGIHICGAGPGYPGASGLHLIRGRFFTESDTSHRGMLAVINEAAAHAFFPGEDPLGKRILRSPQGEWKTVVGVISNSKNTGLDALPAPQAYINEVTWPSATELQLIVRSIADQHMVQAALIGKLRSFDPGAIAKFETLDQTIGEMTAGPRFNGILVASFALIAFLMAVIGVYGVLAFAVARRTQEIGIRMALGAEPRRMLALILREGMLLVFAGVCAASIGVMGLTRYLKSMLYGVSPTDPVTFLAVALALIIAAAIAMALPARRAASVDPVVALRRN